jgi:Flp pilus assembly protein TadG
VTTDTATNGLRRRWHDERGAALVEFGILVPLFFMIVLAMFSGGLAYNQRMDMTHAVREGARYGSALPAETTNWATLVRDAVVNRSGGDLKNEQVCVALVDGTSGGTPVSVPQPDPPAPTIGPWTSVPAGFPANCYDDNSTDAGQRVHVAARRSSQIQALIFTYPIDQKVQATSRHE